MRHRKRWELGESNFGCLIGLIVMLAAIFVAYKVIPIKVKAAELRQVVVDEAKSAGTHNDEKIRAAILKKAADDDLPVGENEIKIRRAENTINVQVDYTVPIDFKVTVYQWHIHHEAENPIF
jgi:hypothetical protein